MLENIRKFVRKYCKSRQKILENSSENIGKLVRKYCQKLLDFHPRHYFELNAPTKIFYRKRIIQTSHFPCQKKKVSLPWKTFLAKIPFKIYQTAKFSMTYFNDKFFGKNNIYECMGKLVSSFLWAFFSRRISFSASRMIHFSTQHGVLSLGTYFLPNKYAKILPRKHLWEKYTWSVIAMKI